MVITKEFNALKIIVGKLSNRAISSTYMLSAWAAQVTLTNSKDYVESFHALRKLFVSLDPTA
jgi:hypothetical protein